MLTLGLVFFWALNVYELKLTIAYEIDTIFISIWQVR